MKWGHSMNVEKFEPTGNNVMLKAEMIKTSGIVLLDATKQAQEMKRFRVFKVGEDVTAVMKPNDIIWLRAHAAVSSYHEDKDANYLIVPETDILAVLGE